jgi:hypothetical protein
VVLEWLGQPGSPPDDDHNESPENSTWSPEDDPCEYSEDVASSPEEAEEYSALSPDEDDLSERLEILAFPYKKDEGMESSECSEPSEENRDGPRETPDGVICPVPVRPNLFQEFLDRFS